MKKIKEILIGTNNDGKYREICDLLPPNIKNILLKNLNLKLQRKMEKPLRKMQ